MDKILPLPSYVCIAGPTACGKTTIALEIARRWPVEIVSVDSALVYRGLDIGSAKPSAAEMASVPHHLIDICEPNEPYSAAQFVKDATRLIAEITQRGNTPVLVGGTMLYYKALIEGLDDLPAATPEIREQLQIQAQRLGWPALHGRLAQVDPVTAQRLQPNDSQRIARALEVWMISGRSLSSFFSDKPTNYFPPLLSLEPQDRAWLHERIAQRFAQMLELGFLDEVRGLMQRENLHADLPSMRAVGYRQAWAALELAKNSPAPINDLQIKSQLMQTGVAATRQLAKRQITWLRSMPERQVVHGDAIDVLPQALYWFEMQLKKFLNETLS